MKSFLIALGLVVLLSSCASRNAFSSLDVSQEEELAIENTRSGKITFGNHIQGIYSLVYLNNVYPQMDKDTHQFYISLYLKDGKEDEASITLDEKSLIQVLKLEEENKFTSLLAMKNSWTSNYLVSFKDESFKNINLVIDSGQFSSGPLKYLVDQK